MKTKVEPIDADFPDLMKQVGLRIAWTRYALHWSQSDLALEANIARSKISLYETGQGNPSLETLSKIAKACQIPVDFLFSSAGLYQYKDLVLEFRSRIPAFRKTRKPL